MNLHCYILLQMYVIKDNSVVRDSNKDVALKIQLYQWKHRFQLQEKLELHKMQLLILIQKCVLRTSYLLVKYKYKYK